MTNYQVLTLTILSCPALHTPQAGSSFLALVNNEREPAVEHKERMEALRDFVMVMWDQDTTVIPKVTI